MAKKLNVINQLRPRILSQIMVDLEKLSERISQNTTYNEQEIYGIMRLGVQGIIAALQAGETVKIDGLLNLTPNLKVGGEVDLAMRPDRGALAELNNPLFWTADKVSNHEHLHKTTEELVAWWNAARPNDPVTD